MNAFGYVLKVTWWFFHVFEPKEKKDIRTISNRAFLLKWCRENSEITFLTNQSFTHNNSGSIGYLSNKYQVISFDFTPNSKFNVNGGGEQSCA